MLLNEYYHYQVFALPKPGITNRYLVNFVISGYFNLILVYVANLILFKNPPINFREKTFSYRPSNIKLLDETKTWLPDLITKNTTDDYVTPTPLILLKLFVIL